MQAGNVFTVEPGISPKESRHDWRDDVVIQEKGDPVKLNGPHPD
jgi:hypothetical protein